MEPEQENNIQEDQAKKTICIVQLARIGDLIQTYLATRSIKSDPSTKSFKTVLVARKKYADPIRHLLEECFDEIHTFDYNDIMFGGANKDLVTVKNNIDNFIENVNKNSIDAVVNLTFSKTSGYLCSLIKSPYRLGVNYDNSNNLIIKDHWSQFVYSNVLTGPLNPFSLVNIFSKIIGTKPSVITENTRNKAVRRIVLHPFTSQERKQWKPSKWSEVLFNIFKTTSVEKITIVGGAGDVEASKELVQSPLLAKFINKIDNQTGKTNIQDVVNTLDESDLFLGHDSMVSHLSSLTSIQSVTIALGSVRPIETAPFGHNNYVIAPLTDCFPCFADQKCSHFKCHNDIPYQTINTFITNVIQSTSSDHLLQGLSPFHTSKVQIYKSKIEESGFLSLEPLIEHNLDVKSVFQKIYRISWLYILAEVEESPSYPIINQATAAQLQHYQGGIKHLYQVTEFGKKYSSYILQEVASQTPSISKIKELSNKIVDVDNLQLSIKEAYPLLSPLIDYYAVIKSNLEGDNVVSITENAYIAYENCSIFCNILNELIDKTIRELKDIQSPPSQTARGRA